MFKYIEAMRKFAFRIMSKTYGGKSKENEAIYDSYVLRDFTILLCFEDDDETRAACKHYNITVKTENGEESILWRRTPFKDPKDQDKGTAIRLLPRKMVRTIESKAQKLTRLAVCRGEASGEGAYLINLHNSSETSEEIAKQKLVREAALQALLAEQEVLRSKKAEEEENRLKEEQRKKLELEDRYHRELEQKKAQEAKELMEQERKLRIEQEEIKRIDKEKIMREIEEKRKQEELNAERIRVEIAEQERIREFQRIESLKRAQEELERQEKIKEEKRRIEAEEKHRRYLQELQRKQEEDKRKLQEVEAEKRRKEEERVCIEIAQREEAERNRKAVEALLLRQEAELRIVSAKKKIALMLWLQKLPRHLFIEEQMNESLDRISPLASPGSSRRFDFIVPSKRSRKGDNKVIETTDLRRVLESLLKKKLDLLHHMAQCVSADYEEKACDRQSFTEKTTILFKIAIILPRTDRTRDQKICDLTRAWIDSRFCFRRVSSHHTLYTDTRVVVVDSQDKQADSHCDAVIFVIPPPWSDYPFEGQNVEEIRAMASSVDDEMPRLVLALSEHFHDGFGDQQGPLVSMLAGSFNEIIHIKNSSLEHEDVDAELLSVCALIPRCLLLNDPQVIEKFTFNHILAVVMKEGMWHETAQQKKDDVVTAMKELVVLLVEELNFNAVEIQRRNVSWPSSDFDVLKQKQVCDYFESGMHLRMDWVSTLTKRYIESVLVEWTNLLNGTLLDVVWRLVRTAPFSVQRECQALFDKQCFRRCILSALEWNNEKENNEGVVQVMYLPRGLVQGVVQKTISQYQNTLTSRISIKAVPSVGNNDESEPHYVGEIDLPPSETPLHTPGAKVKKRHRKETREQIPLLKADVMIQHNEDITNAERRNLSQAEKESTEFTKRLRKLLCGEAIPDMIVGKTTLVGTLRNAPSLNIMK